MKYVQVEEMVVQKVGRYEACDGKLFHSSYACEEYEHELKMKRLSGVKRCSALSCYPPFDGAENSENHDYEWYYPQSEEDIENLSAVYEVDEDYGTGRFCSGDIGHWICVETYDGISWVSTLESSIAYAEQVLNTLGYEMTITEKSKNES